MSDLQIGLMMLGVLVVAAVFAFNWWQERQYRRRAEVAFPGRQEDILLDVVESRMASVATQAPAVQADVREEPRLEPRIEPQFEPLPEVRPAPTAQPAAEGDPPNSQIDYAVEIRAGAFINPVSLANLRQELAAMGRKIDLRGLDHQSKVWQPIAFDMPRYSSVRVSLQLLDRSGPVSVEQLQAFAEAIKTAAHSLSAIAELPQFEPYIERAAELDTFCADVDVVVGINVVAQTGQMFHGTKIRALAEASGLQLQSGGAFHCRDDQGRTLFCLENQEASPFLIDQMRNLTTPGVTFLLDVPRTPDGLRAFDRMVAMSRSFAESLDGMLTDDNRVLLNDTGLDKIRTQLRAIYAAMAQRGIHAGSALALRLFS
jgi:FtsZ-interacting cell division protein ZipA